MTLTTASHTVLDGVNGHQPELRLPALEVRQGGGRVLYSFAVDGKQLPSFAAISRIRRAPGVVPAPPPAGDLARYGWSITPAGAAVCRLWPRR